LQHKYFYSRLLALGHDLFRGGSVGGGSSVATLSIPQPRPVMVPNARRAWANWRASRLHCVPHTRAGNTAVQVRQGQVVRQQYVLRPKSCESAIAESLRSASCCSCFNDQNSLSQEHTMTAKPWIIYAHTAPRRCL